jgi:hypothetical protein
MYVYNCKTKNSHERQLCLLPWSISDFGNIRSYSENNCSLLLVNIHVQKRTHGVRSLKNLFILFNYF